MVALSFAFEPCYFADRLRVVNPHSDVGIATLWTPVRAVMDVLRRAGIDLDPASSRIAVLGNLYGDGLPQLIRNLLWNPQICHVLILGQNLSRSAEELANLLTLGVEKAERLGQSCFRIRGTERCLDTAFDPTLLIGQVRPVVLGKLSAPETTTAVRAFFATLPPSELARRKRVHAPLPVYQPVYFPSEPRAHTIVRQRPLWAWKDVVRRVLRFGVPVLIPNGRRLELQNLKVVVTEPVEDDVAALHAVGFTLADLRAYQAEILSGEQPVEVSYTYGNRLRSYWHLDLIEAASARLAAEPNSRGVFLSLWNPTTDLGVGHVATSTPCLVTLFFRLFQDVLTLTATFRAHNVMSAWLRNLYGLMAIQTEVARQAGGLPHGPITVVSHSITIDPEATERLDLAKQILTAETERSSQNEVDDTTGKRMLQEDPNGYFTFTVDQEAGEVIAVHKVGGETLTQYRGRTAVAIESQIARDGAISDIGHALYVGRQLALMERQVLRRQGQMD
ncbi:Thymidylate synthase [invertebrate metagenome]|uniref:Thymidylate synthase n=1 Tax=invertebrate metagenome TaxID=1711999 RepID=A0A484H615_9ZZZZ